MSPQPRWYEHVPTATGVVACDGDQHRLVWQRGKVKLADHDLGGERAMLVLGGEPCACLRALRLWGDQFGMPPEVFGRMQSWLGPEAALAPAELHLPRTLGMLLSWERAWKAQGYFTKQGKLIERELTGIAVPVLRAHVNAARDEHRCRSVRPVELTVVPAGRPLRLEGRMDRISATVQATLSTDWAVDVWARGIAVVDRAFVLAVTGEAAGGGAEVLAARWIAEGSGARPVIGPALLAPDPEGGWSISWAPSEGGPAGG